MDPEPQPVRARGQRPSCVRRPIPIHRPSVGLNQFHQGRKQTRNRLTHPGARTRPRRPGEKDVRTCRVHVRLDGRTNAPDGLRGSADLQGPVSDSMQRCSSDVQNEIKTDAISLGWRREQKPGSGSSPSKHATPDSAPFPPPPPCCPPRSASSLTRDRQEPPCVRRLSCSKSSDSFRVRSSTAWCCRWGHQSRRGRRSRTPSPATACCVPDTGVGRPRQNGPRRPRHAGAAVCLTRSGIQAPRRPNPTLGGKARLVRAC